MSPRALWLRIALGASAAVASVAAFPVPPPAGVRLSPLPAIVLGGAAGALLFAALAREARPHRRPRVLSTAFLVGWSWVEEALWRRLLLGGGALAVGAPVALAGATALFALAHRDQAAHAVTGSVFGVTYVATGRLVGAAAAHAAYNVLVASAAPHEAPP